MPVVSDAVPASASPYNGLTLRLYDTFVLKFTSPHAWGCRKETISDLYRAHVSSRHAEIGVGSGYFLRGRAPKEQWEILALIDPNRTALSFVKKRLPAAPVTGYCADILRGDTLPSERFRSIAANYVLHCLPGPISSKDIAVRNLASMLMDDGILFGATVLGVSERHNALGRTLLRVCNRTGAFGNLDDSKEGLQELLDRYFETVEIKLERTVAIFVASRPKLGAPAVIDTGQA